MLSQRAAPGTASPSHLQVKHVWHKCKPGQAASMGGCRLRCSACHAAMHSMPVAAVARQQQQRPAAAPVMAASQLSLQ